MVGVARDSSGLVDRAYDDPDGVLREARRRRSDAEQTPIERCIAGWAVGLALRELGEVADAADALSDARARAAELDEHRVAARIATTLAWTLAQLGRSDEALALLADAEPHVDGSDLGHLQLQRGLVLFLRDDVRGSIRHLRAALEQFTASAERLALARAHLNLGVVLGSDGRHQDALAHAESARELAVELDQQSLAAQAYHNLGYAASRVGDIPRALTEMSLAEMHLHALEHTESFRSTVLMDRARVLLDANLIDDACDEVDRALVLARAGSNTVQTADALLLGAQCHLRASEFDQAGELAAGAAELFADSGREGWRLLAELAELQSAAGRDQRRVDGGRAEGVARALVERRWTNEAVSAAIVAVDALIHEGETQRASAVLDVCRHHRPGPTAVERSGLALVRAAFHTINADNRSARRAITDGLALLAENQAAVGAMELRAFGVAHGRALAELGAAIALQDGRPRELLLRAEQGRGATSLLPRARPAAASVEDNDLLVRYRSISHDRNVERASSNAGRSGIDSELAAIEAQLRRRARRSSRGLASTSIDLAPALRALGDRCLVEFVEVNDEVLAVHATSRRTHLHRPGELDVRRHLDQLELGLNRLNRAGASAASLTAGRAVVEESSDAIAEHYLPVQLRDASLPIVIVPTGALHAVPWNSATCLRNRPTSVAPSLTAWWRAKSARRAGARLGLLVGPDLPFALPEARAIAAVGNVDSEVAGRATVTDALATLERVDIAHFACHGRFRADSPLFSSLRLADGDLTFYDLERCERLPHTIVMSACNAGQNAVLDGGALLGMASALVQLGVSSVVAPLTPVNDERSVELMVRLHTHLAAGLEPSEALARASVTSAGELDPTAAPFICFGS